MNDDAKAWGDFWASNAGGNANGCLPARWAEIEEAQKLAWDRFIRQAPDQARVLDLATGDGRVLRWLREGRGDLKLSGIDLAPELPPAPEGTETRGGVAMEDLPFEAQSFDAVVSQFGFEYGDLGSVSGEIARVLRPGGRVGLMVHRGDGPILAHNLARKAAIDWVLGDADVTGAVTRALDAPQAGPQVAAQVAAAIALIGANKFGSTSPAWEIAEALRRACVMGDGEGTSSIIPVIGAVRDQAANEVARIASLARACAAADDRENMVAALVGNGLAHDSTAPVAEPSGRAVADFLTFIRSE